MSIRLRFTLLYNTILAITLLIFGISLYFIQASTVHNAIKNDILNSSQRVESALLRTSPQAFLPPEINNQPPPPIPFQHFSGQRDLQRLPEREIVRILDSSGNLLVSPLGLAEEVLPLSEQGLNALQKGQDWWETAYYYGEPILIYSHPIWTDTQTSYILQIARPLTESQRSLAALSRTLLFASLVTLLIAFGIGWALAGVTLSPIQHITQTAQRIGSERDLTRRVNYQGPPDEVGQLAATFNTMLHQIEQAYQQVAESLAQQRKFVADVSHELRTPLTTLRGNLGLLRRDPPIPLTEQNDILNDMVEESDRLIRLVNDLLILARADSQRSLLCTPLPILPILQDVCRQAQILAPHRTITLDSPDLTILGDRDAFKQVLLILIDNAIKYTTGGISIHVFDVSQKQIKIQVCDQGEGIPPEKLPHVFERFYRSEENANVPGFGLGLPIAKALIEGQGGSIELHSQPGQGSCITLRLAKAA
jgi:signal transduction histidine kinase